MNKNRRIRTVELSLTPRQVVLLWLASAAKRKFVDDGLQSWRPRVVIANAVSTNVRNSMKGEADLVIERAVAQAQVEADSLYMVVIDANVAVQEGLRQRWREFNMLFGYLGAVLRGNCLEVSVRELYGAVRMFAEEIIVLQMAISKLATELLAGQTPLFRDVQSELDEQLEMLDWVVKNFNRLAIQRATQELDLKESRNNLTLKADRLLSSWSDCAELGALDVFDNPSAYQARWNHLVSKALSSETQTER